jgi:hypothetical protein
MLLFVAALVGISVVRALDPLMTVEETTAVLHVARSVLAEGRGDGTQTRMQSGGAPSSHSHVRGSPVRRAKDLYMKAVLDGSGHAARAAMFELAVMFQDGLGNSCTVHHTYTQRKQCVRCQVPSAQTRARYPCRIL